MALAAVALWAGMAVVNSGCTQAQAGPFGGDKWDYVLIICTEVEKAGSITSSFDFTTPQEEGRELTIAEVAEKLKVSIRRKGAEKAPNTTDVLNGLGAQGWELVTFSESRVTTMTGSFQGTGGGTTGAFAKYRWILKRKA
jgi:hypothetical protein